MQYLDTQRIIRRESSLILTKRSISEGKQPYHAQPTSGRYSLLALGSESRVSLLKRAKGSVQKEIVTYLFTSMLNSIIESWEVINQDKKEDSNKEFGTVTSGIMFSPKKKKSLVKNTKIKRSKIELLDDIQDESPPTCWWSSPDEKAVIRFRNGNLYEGNISMKCMQGEGYFKWADGTTYSGHFDDNEMNGRGIIQWKDDTWYEGEFVGNLRNGNGLYVDSRKQCSYIGQWYSGTKHGRGIIYYTHTFKNNYDGQWHNNVRHGFGSREYCTYSGYEGEWDLYVREGKGLMIWPNHDFYRGEWKNGVMSGYGTYIWDACYNNSLSHPSIIMYRGQWLQGQRNGCGMLNLGLGFGAHYSGEFKNNQKHGAGMLVSNNGLILQNKQLFQDDNLALVQEIDRATVSRDWKREQVIELYKFDISDNSVGLCYHVKEAIKNVDKQQQIRLSIINKFFESNKRLGANIYQPDNKEILNDNICNDLVNFELRLLRKSLQCYESDLKRIYYKYCTICNAKEITFSPILIRLYLWQIYLDCNIHEKGLTLVEIDNIFSQNPKWLARSSHDPFEPIFFWQFLHSFISVARRLYAKKQLPDAKPDTIMANAFRTFMDRDILPGIGRQKGRFVNGYAEFIPLKSLYKLYLSLGEPHTLLTFLRAVRRPPHYEEHLQPAPVEASDNLSLGHNVYTFGDELTFILNSYDQDARQKQEYKCKELKLSNFGNLSSKSLIRIFSVIFPQVSEENKVLNLNVEITFLEFFEIFVACAIDSVCFEDAGSQEREQCYLKDDGAIAPPQSLKEF